MWEMRGADVTESRWGEADGGREFGEMNECAATGGRRHFRSPTRGWHPIRIFKPDLSLGIRRAVTRIAPWPVRISMDDGRRTENFSAPGASACG